MNADSTSSSEPTKKQAGAETQALNSATVRNDIKNILLNHAGLYETLREGP